MKTSDDHARDFKLHNCIGNKKFEKQVKSIQLDAFKAGIRYAARIDQHHHFPMQDTPINAPSAKAILAAAEYATENDM